MGDEEMDADARKAAVRARMAAEAEQTKKKKGFMTPARKSKLRMLLRKKAAEELKKEEERKKEERRRVVVERCGGEKPLDVPLEGLQKIVQDYYNHILETESSKYDLELKLVYNDFIINDLTQKVTDLRGKFVKPTLKKVSKFEDKFAQLNKKASEFKFKAELSKGDAKAEDGAAPAPAEGEAAPAEAAPAEAAPAEEAPAEAAPAEEAPAEAAPAEEAPAEAAPVTAE